MENKDASCSATQIAALSLPFKKHMRTTMSKRSQAKGRMHYPYLISYASAQNVPPLYLFLFLLPFLFSADNLRGLLRSKATGRVKPTACPGCSQCALLEGDRGHRGWWGPFAGLASGLHVYLSSTLYLCAPFRRQLHMQNCECVGCRKYNIQWRFSQRAF